MMPTFKVIALVGYCKAGVSGPRGQVISACLGSPKFPDQWTEVKISEGDGIFLHGRTRKKMLWWLSEQWLIETDLIRVETKVAELGVGRDEDRTMTLIFALDPTCSLVEVRWPGLGYRDYPLLKGRLREISRVSLSDMRELQIRPVREDEFDTNRKGEGNATLVGK